MSAPVGPAEDAIIMALQVRDDFYASKEFEALEAVESDVASAFRRAMRHGSPRLRSALVSAALNQPAVLNAA